MFNEALQQLNRFIFDNFYSVSESEVIWLPPVRELNRHRAAVGMEQKRFAALTECAMGNEVTVLASYQGKLLMELLSLGVVHFESRSGFGIPVRVGEFGNGSARDAGAIQYRHENEHMLCPTEEAFYG